MGSMSLEKGTSMKKIMNSKLLKEHAINRRDFTRHLVAMLAAVEVGLGRIKPANATKAANAAGQSGNYPNLPFSFS